MAFSIPILAALGMSSSQDVIVNLMPGLSKFTRILSLVQLADPVERVSLGCILDTQRSTNEWPISFSDRVTSFELDGVVFPLDPAMSDFSSSPDSDGVIAANFVSDFSGGIFTLLLTPTQLILNPVDPFIYAYDRQIMFSLSENILHPSVSALVSVTDISADDDDQSSPPRFREFSISTAIFKDVVPSNIMEDLVEALQLRGIRSSFRRSHDDSHRITSITLPDCSAEVVSALPLLEYAISGDTGFTYIRLFGEDYIEYTNPEQTACELTLTSVDQMGSCSIGLNTLRKTVLYIDYRNRMIGFGEII